MTLPSAAPARRPASSRGSRVATTLAGGRRPDLLLAVVVAAYSAVLGGAAGVVWEALARRVPLAAAANGSAAASKALLDDDMSFVLVTLVAGALVVIVLLLAAGEAGGGPAALVGLAVGGVLGALVAAHLGAQLRAGDFTTAALSRRFPGNSAHTLAVVRSVFGFRLRIHALLLGWPVAAVVLQALVVMLRRPAGGQRR